MKHILPFHQRRGIKLPRGCKQHLRFHRLSPKLCVVDEDELGVELEQRKVQVYHPYEGVLFQHLRQALVRLQKKKKKTRKEVKKSNKELKQDKLMLLMHSPEYTYL